MAYETALVEKRMQGERGAAMTRLDTITTLPQALHALGVAGGVSTPEEIQVAFRQRVKEAADGAGSYQGDMDVLTQAKEFLLHVLEQHQEQARVDTARVQEREEDRRRHARERKQAEISRQDTHAHQEEISSGRQKEPSPGAHAERQQQEEAAGAPSPQGVPPVTEGASSAQAHVAQERIAAALQVVQECQHELAELQQREHAWGQQLLYLHQQHRSLEQTIQQAARLAEQVWTLLAPSQPSNGGDRP